MPATWITADLDDMLQTDEFAYAATFKSATINVIFDRQYLAVNAGGEIQVESSEPVALCKATDVSTAVQGDTITIDSVAYTIVEVEPDFTGTTNLRLRL